MLGTCPTSPSAKQPTNNPRGTVSGRGSLLHSLSTVRTRCAANSTQLQFHQPCKTLHAQEGEAFPARGSSPQIHTQSGYKPIVAGKSTNKPSPHGNRQVLPAFTGLIACASHTCSCQRLCTANANHTRSKHNHILFSSGLHLVTTGSSSSNDQAYGTCSIPPLPSLPPFPLGKQKTRPLCVCPCPPCPCRLCPCL